MVENLYQLLALRVAIARGYAWPTRIAVSYVFCGNADAERVFSLGVGQDGTTRQKKQQNANRKSPHRAEPAAYIPPLIETQLTAEFSQSSQNNRQNSCFGNGIRRWDTTRQ